MLLVLIVFNLKLQTDTAILFIVIFLCIDLGTVKDDAVDLMIYYFLFSNQSLTTSSTSVWTYITIKYIYNLSK